MKSWISIQSRECSPELLERLSGSSLFPERGVGAAIVTTVCRDGGALLYLTAPEMVDTEAQVRYFAELLPPRPAERVADRLRRVRVVSLADSSARWLSDKLLDPDSADGVAARQAITSFVDQQRALGAEVGLSYFEPSVGLQRLAAELGVRGDQTDAAHIPLGTKAAGRAMFHEAGIEIPAGSPECRTVRELAEAVAALLGQGHRKFVLKLSSTEYAAGQGNALLDLTGIADDAAGDADALVAEVLGRLPAAALIDGKIGWPGFAEAISSAEVIAEELIEGAEVRSPSFQGTVGPDGRAAVVSTHEQVLGAGGQTYVGSSFPAHDDYRATVIDHGLRIGRKLAGLGVRHGDYGVDFLAVRSGGGWRVLGCEVNIRATGTKHGFAMATGLLGVLPDAAGRLFVDGEERVYQASDGIADARYVGLHPDRLIKCVQASDLRYDSDRKTGVVLHMMSAAPRYGKFGAVCIATNRSEAGRMMRELRALVDELGGS